MKVKENNNERLEFEFMTAQGRWNCQVRNNEQLDTRKVAEELNCEHMDDSDRELDITNADVVKVGDLKTDIRNRGNGTTVVDSGNIDDVDTSNRFRDGISARFD